MKFDALIFLSGGMDSTYCAWKWMKDNPEKTLLIHHIDLVNHEGRARLEARAVENILRWFTKSGLKNFKYTETHVNYKTLPGFPYDIELAGFFQALILRKHEISEVIICASSHDLGLPGYENRAKRRYDIIKAMVPPETKLNYVYPIIEMDRTEVIQGLPVDLRKMTWFCRRPRSGQPCRECATCKETLPYL